MRLLFFIFIFIFSPFALAQAPSQNPTYFQEVGKMIGEIRGVKFFLKICNEHSPELATNNQKAYDDWYQRHVAFIDEMEAQLSVMYEYWKNQPSKARDGILTPEQLSTKVNEGLQQEVKSIDRTKLNRSCGIFAQALTSSRYDFEATYSDRVSIIRKGPR